jgi:predicted ATPase
VKYLAGRRELHGSWDCCGNGGANLNECEACFREALATAREQGTRGYELRAAVSLVGLCRDQGREAEARDLLAPVYGWFTEGFDTADLKEAKAVLDQLA